ncbi:MAG: glycosyltransferase family 2 protein [Terriglobia bacterium]
MPPISATIITHNEAKNIARCIGSLACADEIIVVDADSTDRTREIAAGLGAAVLLQPWEGFAAQKNFAARRARYDWIVSLDADEELDRAAQLAVARWKTASPSAAAYRFRRRARYLGRWIRHSGWYPDYKTRLYDRRHGEWQGEYVHESVRVRGNVETLPGEILHYTCDSLEEHRQRIEFYTNLAVAELLNRGVHPSRARRALLPAWTFVHSYFLRAGFLDGPQGFWIAWMAARYVARKYQKWSDLAGAQNSGTVAKSPKP